MDFSVIPALNSLSVEWQSLFMDFRKHLLSMMLRWWRALRLMILSKCAGYRISASNLPAEAPLLLFCTYWPFSALANWLTQCMDILQEGRSGILRFTIPGYFRCCLRTFSVTSSKSH